MAADLVQPFGCGHRCVRQVDVGENENRIVGLVQARELAVKDRGVLRTVAHAAKKVGLLQRSSDSAKFGRGSSDPCVVFEVVDD